MFIINYEPTESPTSSFRVLTKHVLHPLRMGLNCMFYGLGGVGCLLVFWEIFEWLTDLVMRPIMYHVSADSRFWETFICYNGLTITYGSITVLSAVVITFLLYGIVSVVQQYNAIRDLPQIIEKDYVRTLGVVGVCWKRVCGIAREFGETRKKTQLLGVKFKHQFKNINYYSLPNSILIVLRKRLLFVSMCCILIFAAIYTIL